MADTEKNTETNAAPKKKSTAKAKTAAKPKAKKSKPKAETASKAKTVTAALYKKEDSNTESSPTGSSKQKSFTSLVLIAVLAILVITTAYKLDTQLSDLSAPVGTQENTVATVTAPVATTQADLTTNEPVAKTQADVTTNKEETPSAVTPVRQAPPAIQEIREQARAKSQQRAAKYNESLQQRRQAFEKEMQLKRQEYASIIQAHQQERAKLEAEQNDVIRRMRQNHLETKNNIDEIRKQISELHEEIRRLLWESSQAQRQQIKRAR